MKHLLPIIYLSVVILLFVNCEKKEDSNEVDESTIPVTIEYTIYPKETDENISAGFSAQYASLAYEPEQRTPKLFIMLGGTRSSPSMYQNILKTASASGYYALGITYENETSITEYCENTSTIAINCSQLIAEELVYGIDKSGKIEIPNANGIQNRIIKALTYLDQLKPEENWKQFLKDGNVIWNKISLAGHSQGSIIALYLSKEKELNRVSLFSGPFFKVIPIWARMEGKTPVDRIYAFTHNDDLIFPGSKASFTWDKLNIPSSSVSISYNTAQEFNEHRFTTSIEISNANSGLTQIPEHGGTIVDNVSPINTSGDLVFENVWRWMITGNSN